MNYKQINRFTEKVGPRQPQLQESIDLTILDDLGAQKRITEHFKQPQ